MATKKKADETPDPDKLIREVAGTYRSADRRFEVRQSDTAWYVVDSERQNDFGQELMHGPFATLKEAREAIPGARKVTPLPLPKLKAGGRDAAPAKPPAPPKSWIDLLPEAEARNVRRLVRALEREGVDQAEDWVRDSRKPGSTPLARRLIEHRLERIVDDADRSDRTKARDRIRRAVDLLADEGTFTSAPLPGWALVELEPGEGPPPRRLRPKV